MIFQSSGQKRQISESLRQSDFNWMRDMTGIQLKVMINKVIVVCLILTLTLHQSNNINNNGKGNSGNNGNSANNGNSNANNAAKTNNAGGKRAACPECFKNWNNKYKGKYGFSDTASQYRKNVFNKNYVEIEDHNALTDATFKMGVNQFTGLTQEEFEQFSLGQNSDQPNSKVVDPGIPAKTPPNPDGLPTKGNSGNNGNRGNKGNNGNNGKGNSKNGKARLLANGQESYIIDKITPNTLGRLLQQQNFFNFLGWDWRGVEGALSPAKDQGKCGSCYAFAAVAAVQSAIMIFRGYWSIDLSEQQLIDCSYNIGNRGCVGGFKDRSLNYVQQFGLVAQNAYPYQEVQNTYCKYSSGAYKISRVEIVNGCGGLRRAVRKAPVAVSVSVNGWNGWKNFANGVIQCPQNSVVDHAVLLVGYTSQLHWIVKNSWGPEWGEKGYIKIDVFQNCNICLKVGAQAIM